MVLPRVLTALVLAPLVLAIFWFGSIPFFLFVMAICLFAIWEFTTMAADGGYPNQPIMSLVGGALVLLALYLDGSPVGPIAKAPGPIFIFLLWCFAVFVREFAREDKGHSFLRIITTVAGVTFLALSLGHLLLLRDLRVAGGEGFRPIGREVTFFLLVIIWTVDTGAWVVGRAIGSRPLAPRLSPKKSWEGAIGGTVLACGFGWLYREAFLSGAMGRLESVFIALVVAIAAQFSDLIESLIKRSFGAKDSSQLLPGHGGVLDRFDSFIFAAPFYYYMLVGTGRFQ